MLSLTWYRCVLLVVPVVAVLAVGCKTNRVHPDTGVLASPTQPLQEAPGVPAGTGLSDIDAAVAALSPVYFDYDSATLGGNALAALTRNAEILNAQPNVRVVIEGHCDERGTQEYNLVLGERRAAVVRDQLIRLGVSPERLLPISYGKKRPVATGTTEAAWAKNRLCAFARPPA